MLKKPSLKTRRNVLCGEFLGTTFNFIFLRFYFGRFFSLNMVAIRRHSVLDAALLHRVLEASQTPVLCCNLKNRIACEIVKKSCIKSVITDIKTSRSLANFNIGDFYRWMPFRLLSQLITKRRHEHHWRRHYCHIIDGLSKGCN